MLVLILKSPRILGFLKARPKKIVLCPLKAKTVATLIEQKVFPSPLTDDVTNKVLEPFKSCVL